MKQKYLILLIGIIVVVAIGIIMLMDSPTQESYKGTEANSIVGVKVGNQAPDFELTDIDGQKFQLSDFKGKVVVIDLMATWCGPCITEMGHLRDIYSEYSSEDLVIISIDVDDTETIAQLSDFRSTYGDDWTFAANGGSVGQTYQATGIPKIYIIDQEGLIAFSHTGVTSSSDLSSVINRLL